MDVEIRGNNLEVSIFLNNTFVRVEKYQPDAGDITIDIPSYNSLSAIPFLAQ